MEQPLTNKQYLLERFPGKGGWTYVLLPEISKDKDAPFGIVKVKGSIDGYEISNYTLMPYGKGVLLMAVKAEIRKKIGKEEGDHVRVVLYRDNSVYKVPEEFKTKLEEYPGLFAVFKKHKSWEQKMCVNWIYSAKRPETVSERILKTIGRLQRREKIV
ncbi:YdeI/OmpD-associated family protein [uncultured Flavobacterium sp.]|uniref:YdeI/OmpD-associated family protein n=1 Tax=uncultured Flavobacterium sp. TaxID=165435 RepID=UPI0025E259BE|nr:YdeI/OmpD-associated family protein [uncultured Flavobacterium sp.]